VFSSLGSLGQNPLNLESKDRSSKISEFKLLQIIVSRRGGLGRFEECSSLKVHLGILRAKMN
jgi:hypothetical protein